MSKEIKYWKGLEELTNDTDFVKQAEQEFPEYLPIQNKKSDKEEENASTHRRDFLKMMGFGVAAASLAACEAPVKKAIPYLNKPADVDPSIPNYYSSTYISEGDVIPVTVKTREGRPIHVSGNKYSPLTKGSLNVRSVASVLNLYDETRLKGPVKGNKSMDWPKVDSEIKAGLASAGNIALVSSTINSPSTLSVIEKFKGTFPGAKHLTFDPISYSGILDAHKSIFGKRVLPQYSYDKADVIVSVASDFLGTGYASSEHARQFGETRKLSSTKKNMSRLYQFETYLSLTGSNSDYRTSIKPSQEGLVVSTIYNKLASKFGYASVAAKNVDLPNLDKAVKDLIDASKGKSIFVSGSNDPAVQLLAVGINQMLGNYGSTLDIEAPAFYRKGDDSSFHQFISDLKSGKYGAVIFYDINPVYSAAKGNEIAEVLKKNKSLLSISFSDKLDETSSLCTYTCPDHNYLESWNDAEPVAGHLYLAQPTIAPLFKTRQAQESLLVWSDNKAAYYDYVKSFWKKNVYSTIGTSYSFEDFWTKSLHDGYVNAGSMYKSLQLKDSASAASSLAQFTSDISTSLAKNYAPANKGLELKLYQKVAIGSGKQANNPWLQECPDPISRATWDNYVAISPKLAKELDLKQRSVSERRMADVVKITVKGKGSVELPVLLQPGQKYNTISIAVGYGREKAGKVANGIGKNVFQFMKFNDGYHFDFTDEVSIEKTGEKYPIAQTQTHHTIMGRNIVQGATLGEYQKDPQAGRYFPEIATLNGKKKPNIITLWVDQKKNYINHHWGLTIDLNSCFGCAACVVACQSENNVPVVGKEEVINTREMHWIRIDRYYSSVDEEGTLDEREKAAENPSVTFQPMMCQQCNHAPCETVCPVLATVHSSEGLNQMTYNRCIGTRYCANNCPYKVRRFNWFKYHNNKQFEDVNTPMNGQLGKMVLNPDVTVRSRGVMEKCTFCVQRIQSGKLEAKKEGRRPEDKDITTACAEACPAEAITFGDMMNEDSKVHKVLSEENSDRAFHVLEELNVQPNIAYLTKIRNTELA